MADDTTFKLGTFARRGQKPFVGLVLQDRIVDLRAVRPLQPLAER